MTPEQIDNPAYNAARARAIRRSVGVVLLAFGVIRFLQVAGIGAAGTFYNVYFDTQLDVPTSRIGLISAAARLASVPAALQIPALAARWSAPRIVTLASAATALSILPLILSRDGIGGVGLWGLWSSLAMPTPSDLLDGDGAAELAACCRGRVKWRAG